MNVLYNEKNLGINANQNLAIRNSTGDLITFLACDDVFTPNRFRDQIDLLNRDRDLEIVYANGRVLNKAGVFGRLHDQGVVDLLHKPARQILDYLYTHVSPLFLQTALLRRDFLVECGGNDERILADDWVLNIRFFQRLVGSGRHAYVDKDVFHYRMHEGNQFRNARRHTRLMKEVVRVYTPPELKSEARANIYWSISENHRQNGRPWSRAGYFLLSSLNGWDPKRARDFLAHTPRVQHARQLARSARLRTVGNLELRHLERRLRQRFGTLTEAMFCDGAPIKALPAGPDPAGQLGPLFDAAYYGARYPDVAAAGTEPHGHFMSRGLAERRNPNAFFDTAFYLEKYPDIAASGMNPLVHYVRFGAREGRDPHPFFSTSYYLEKVPIVAASGFNPLLHYLHFGAARRRLPHPAMLGSKAFAQLSASERRDGEAVFRAMAAEESR
jgi:hypothetical protein